MIVDQEYWDKSYAQTPLSLVSTDDSTRKLINEILPKAKPSQSAFEFGCFPGRYLIELGKLGYSVSGCDQTPRVESELAPWMSSHGVQTGDFYRCDFRQTPRKRYDIVASFGFIEHFHDYVDVYRFHFEFAKPGAIVLVTFPNFRGIIQNTLHKLFDRENLDRHVIAAMQLDDYRRAARDYGEIIYCRHYGGFDFWTDYAGAQMGTRRRRALAALEKTRRLWPFLPTLSSWAPYAGIAVRVNT